MTDAERGGAAAQPAPDADMASLARGGRLNAFGFVLRLAARLPFLFIAGRVYGAAEPALKLDVPLDVEVGWGEHWGAAH